MAESGNGMQQSKKEAREQVEKTSVGEEIRSWILTLAVAVLLAFLIGRFLILNAVVPTGSMIPTIPEHSRVIANRLSYLEETPQRGDLVIFRYPDDESTNFVKRVIGLPGETVEIRAGKVYIDDSETPLTEDYLAEEPLAEDYGPYTVPEGCYLMLGDNRNHSNDARFWQNTYVSEEQILGKVKLQYYPSFVWYGDYTYPAGDPNEEETQ